MCLCAWEKVDLHLTVRHHKISSCRDRQTYSSELTSDGRYGYCLALQCYAFFACERMQLSIRECAIYQFVFWRADTGLRTSCVAKVTITPNLLTILDWTISSSHEDKEGRTESPESSGATIHIRFPPPQKPH